MSIFSSLFSLRKSKHILRHVYRLFLRKQKRLPAPTVEKFKTALLSLEQSLLEKKRKEADAHARTLQDLEKNHLQKSPFEKARDLIFVLAFALIAAILIRQVWFELYEIPSGSMRPTLKEQDRLVVSKTAFGINLPLTPNHLYFDQDLVKRGGIFIFTGEDMDIRNVDTLYFYLFPGKKQYVKRLMGKPGDTLYFYGGKIYGVDQEGRDISSELQNPEFKNIEHIPFIHFEGKVTTSPSQIPGVFSPVILYQMNEPVARMAALSSNQSVGEMLNTPAAISDFGELWGFKNFATARLLTKDQVKQYTDHPLHEIADAPLYLELKHTPSLRTSKIGRDEYGRTRPLLGFNSSLIPMQEEHLRTIFSHIYTARFTVEDGKALSYGGRAAHTNPLFLPELPGIPDGCYEFYDGKAYEIKWQGLTFELPSSHPLYRFDARRVQLLYNVGIEWDLHVTPQGKQQRLDPARFAYFREGDLYLLGSPVLKKEDPTLVDFLRREEQRKSLSPLYQPFKDAGPPTAEDGTLDAPFVKERGLQIPPKMYLALGDNHAMSGDSRDFGFVPQGNLRGTPSWIFWPPGPRWGAPKPIYPFFNFPRSMIWLTASLIFGAWYVHHRKKYRTIKF
ncbi:MAG: signal peptidase I [Chlamydiales bacterium]